MRNFAPDLRRGNLTSPDIIAFTKLFTRCKVDTASRLSNSRAISTTATGRRMGGRQRLTDVRFVELYPILSLQRVRIFFSLSFAFFPSSATSLSRLTHRHDSFHDNVSLNFRFIRSRDARHVGTIRGCFMIYLFYHCIKIE